MIGVLFFLQKGSGVPLQVSMRKELHFPEDFSYACIDCGACCKDWSIEVDRDTYENFITTELFSKMQAGSGPSELFHEEPGGEHSCRRREDGSCIFLTPRSGCIIHREIGHKSKPLGCRQFPFKITLTPDGAFVGVSFHCRACQRNSGKPLESYREEILSLLEGFSYVKVIEGDIILDEGISMDWEAYMIVENYISSLLLKSSDLEEALWTALVNVSMLAMICREGCIEKLTIPVITRTLYEEAGAAFQRDEIFQQLTLFYTLAVVGILEASPPDEPRHITEAILQGGSFKSTTFGKVISMSAFSSYFLNNPSPWKGEYQRRFIEHLIFRKFLLGSEPLLHNLAALFTAYGLIEFYFYFGAFQDGHESPDMEDLYRASGIVEQGFSAHTTMMIPFLKLFAQGFKDQLQLKLDEKCDL